LRARSSAARYVRRLYRTKLRQTAADRYRRARRAGALDRPANRRRLAVTLADTGFLELPPLRLEYRMIGPRPDAAPTIVMLHDGLGCVGLWDDFPDRLAAATGAGVFVYSRAGYGQSSPVALPRPLTFLHAEACE